MNASPTHEVLDRLRGIPHPGDVIGGKYVVESACRRGGVALELTAVAADVAQRPDRARVDIRMLPPEWCADPGILERFLYEGQAAAPLTSEHVVRVFGVGTLDGGAPYFVLEHLEGPGLDDLLGAWGTVTVPTAIDWVLQAAEALAEAHARGISHRRLKLSSLVLAQQTGGARSIKVRDFGLSRVVDPFTGYADAGFENAALANRRLALDPDALRSVRYVSPEQLHASHVIDGRADVWSLGVILHELIAGRPPFGGETVPSICTAVLTQEAPHLCTLRPHVPGAVDRAVRRCLQRDPDQRFTTLATMARALAPFGTELARASCARIEQMLPPERASNEPIPLVSRGFTPRGTARMWADDASAANPQAASKPGFPTVRMDRVAEPTIREKPMAAYPVDLPEPGDVDSDAADLEDVAAARKFQAPASGRLVALALLMLCALGAAAFAGVYETVHAPHANGASNDLPAVINPTTTR